ncbi:MAG: hypothetical protein AB1742_16270 [bacterium]
MTDAKATRAVRATAAAFFLALCVFAAAAPPGAAERIFLENRYERGDVYVYSLKMTGRGSSMVLGAADPALRNQEFFMEIRNGMEMKVLEVAEDGAAAIEGRVTDWSVSFNDAVISSPEKAEKLPADSPMKKLTEPFLMKVAKDGRVLEFSGSIVESELFPIRTGEALGGWSHAVFPDHPVSVGETWKGQMPLFPGGGKDAPAVNVEYVLEGIESVKGLACAVIEARTDADVPEINEKFFSAPPFAGAGVEMKKLKQKLNGKIYFAHAEGIMVAYEFSMRQESEMRVRNPLSRKKPIEMKVVMDMEGLLNLE